MNNTLITMEEYVRIVLTMNPKEHEPSIRASWEVFDMSADYRIDYKEIIMRVNSSMTNASKAM